LKILWTDKYRPYSLDQYVWKDEQFRIKVEQWIEERSIPNVLFAGSSGVGKTTAARMILNLMNIPKGDIKEIDASKKRQIDVLENEIDSFVSCWALNETGLKYIILDEADSMSQLAQRMLRKSIEDYSDVTRFIFTCNYPNKIIEPLRSRLQIHQFSSLDKEEFIVRIGEILSKENIKYEFDDLMNIVDISYPDLRKCINLAEDNSYDGILHKPKLNDTIISKDYLIEFVDLFKKGMMLEARKLLIASASQEDYVDIYRFFYQNLELFGDTEDQKDETLLIIRKGLVYDGTVADREINLSATMIELIQNWRKSQ